MKYRRKPVVIEAEQFVVRKPSTEMSFGEEFMGYRIYRDFRGWYLIIPTLEGAHRANEGDWIITGVHGERYPCKPDIFEQTYEALVPELDDKDELTLLEDKILSLCDELMERKEQT